MRVAVLVTGGKDSALALYYVLKEGYDVKYLASMIPLREDSWMFHYPNMWLVDLFAEAAGVPLVKAETDAVGEKEVEDLKRLISSLDVDGVVSGAVASDYQKTRIEGICKEIGIKCVAPLWHRDPLVILNEILELKLDVIITAVSAYGFDKAWLRRKIDEKAVKDLAKLNRLYGVSIVGEGGEYETLVLDAPFLRKRIHIVNAETVWKGQGGYLKITKAELQNKWRKSML
ncbi:MAG: TIGR00289 family protein [Candidatus Bathyarchaeota archaeon]|jgi:predicted ATP pyrophosphatase (TIGR00289 family)|nr:TIGR00289 family protein [Candidatus Bathyarchaeota archaeon]